jgi:hypothetical protein
MQLGPGARPEFANKRLVAVKKMKKRFEGGWAECEKLKELKVRLPQLPLHLLLIFRHPFPSSRSEVSHTTPT